MVILTLSLVLSASQCNAPFPLDRIDAGLQASLDERVREAGLTEAVNKGKLAISLVDLTQRGRSYVAGINEDHMLYAASLPKIAILLAITHLIHQGRVHWAPDFAFRLKKMITISNNAFASWGYDVATPARIAEVMQDPDYCLYQRPHGGLWVGRPFRKSARSYRDPLFNISHGATARQTARFYVMLDAGALVSPYWSERMRDLMAPPEYTHKIVAAIGGRRGVDFVARKSGTWRTFHADSALVQHFGKRYVLVALADMANGEQVIRTVARFADDIIMQGEHRLPR